MSDSNPSQPSSAPLPSSILARLRATRGLGLFALLAACMPILAGAAILSARELLGAAQLEMQFHSLSGRLRFASPSWPGARRQDEIQAIGGVRVEHEPERIRAELLKLEPGPTTLSLRRDGVEFQVPVEALPASLEKCLLVWLRVLTGVTLLGIGCFAFLARPGQPVTWLFLLFCSALATHLLGYLAILHHPRLGLILESLGLYLTTATGQHLFTIFPRNLPKRGAWAALYYLPPLGAALVLIPSVWSRPFEPLLASVIAWGAWLAVLTSGVCILLVYLQYRRAAASRDATAQARSRILIVAVTLGLAVPALLGLAPLFLPSQGWIANSSPVLIFVVLTAYSIVRHNALEMDRFTASVLGYAGSIGVLAGGFGALLLGLPLLAPTAGLAQSPAASASITAVAFVLFSPVYRRVRKKVDRWFLREAIEEDSALKHLQGLARTVRSSDLTEAFRAAVDSLRPLQGERVELWIRAAGGALLRVVPSSSEAGSSAPPLPTDGALARALGQGSGGVEGLVDQPFEPAAQHELWSRDLTLAAPIFARDRLQGFLGLGRKPSGVAYTRRERAFLETVALHLGIAMERGGKETRLGEYRLVERLGTGGMAEVHLAEKQGPGGFELQVALKRMLPHLSQEPDYVAMFLDEARIAAQLRHPNIVSIYSIEEHENTYFLAMEYLDGPTLKGLIQQAADRGLNLPLPIVAALADSVLGALQYAHGKTDRQGRSIGLIHRDVKPANILTSRHGAFKLADFGLARAEARLYQTQPGSARGTLLYMPPEQYDARPLGPTADLYSAGAVIYEALTGRKAFPNGPTGDPPIPATYLNPGLPASLNQFFAQALAVWPEDRFASAEQMRRAFHDSIAPVAPASAEAVAEFMAGLLTGVGLQPAASPLEITLAENPPPAPALDKTLPVNAA